MCANEGGYVDLIAYVVRDTGVENECLLLPVDETMLLLEENLYHS